MYDFKVVGLWMGLFVGIFTQAVALVILTLMIDWQKQAENALDRVTHLHLQCFLSNRIRVRKIEISPFLHFNDHEIIS